MTCGNSLAQVQPCSGAGMKERGSLHSQDSWMVDINRQINAIIPMNMVLIAFFEMPSKHRITFVTHFCTCKHK